MKPLVCFLVIVSMQSIKAGTIGDFAPLAVGNTWVYDITSREDNNGIYSKRSNGIHTVTVLTTNKSGDTAWYYMSHHLQRTTDSLCRDTLAGTASVDYVYYDTLIDVGGSVRLTSILEGAFPVRMEHDVDTGRAGIDSVEFVNNAWEFTSLSNGSLRSIVDPTSRFTTYRFRAGIGIILFTSSGGVHMQMFSSRTTLRSFTDGGSGIVPVSSQSKRHIPTVAARSVSTVALPHVNVLHRGKAYDLMGKVQPEYSRRKKSGSQKWSQQVYDLFK